MVRKRSSSHDGPLTATDVNDLYSISEGLEKIKTSYRQMTVEQKRNLDPRFETILRRDDIDIDSLGRFSLVLERMDLLVAKDIGTDNADAAQMKAILKRGENERLAWVDEFKNESVPQKPDYYITVPNGARHTKSVLVPGAKDIAFQNAKSDALSKLAKLKGKFLPKLDFIEGSIGLIWFGHEYFPDGKISYPERPVIVSQIIDDSNMICEIGDRKVWVIGNTHGLIDGEGHRVILSGLYRCLGTTRYQTVLGATKTVYRIEKFK